VLLGAVTVNGVPLHGQNGVYIPSSYDSVERAVYFPADVASAAHWYVSHSTYHNSLRNVESGGPPIQRPDLLALWAGNLKFRMPTSQSPQIICMEPITPN